MTSYLKIDWNSKPVWMRINHNTKKTLWVDEKSIILMDGEPILPSNNKSSITKDEFDSQKERILNKINNL